MSDEMKDFDALWKEQEESRADGPQGRPFKVYGAEHRLPASPPAGVMLDILRMQAERGPDASLSVGELYKMADYLFTREAVRSWSEQGMTADHLEQLIIWAMGVYNDTLGGNAQGNRRRRRARPASASLKTGRSSKRTSGASTA